MNKLMVIAAALLLSIMPAVADNSDLVERTEQAIDQDMVHLNKRVLVMGPAPKKITVTEIAPMIFDIDRGESGGEYQIGLGDNTDWYSVNNDWGWRLQANDVRIHYDLWSNFKQLKQKGEWNER